MNSRKDRWRIFAIIAVFLIITISTSLYLTKPNESTNQTTLLKPTPSPMAYPTENWGTLTNLGYTIKYPQDAKAEARDGETLILFVGQKQIASGRTQTELFDGYIVRIGEIVSDSKLALEEISKAERDNAENNCQVREDGKVTQLVTKSIDGKTGYQYSAEGCYIDYTETIVSFENKTYRISQSYTGDATDQPKYKEITNQILSTLNFED